jgi:hypothetical protein
MLILGDSEEKALCSYLERVRQEAVKPVQVRYKVANLSSKALLILRKAKRRNEEMLL